MICRIFSMYNRMINKITPDYDYIPVRIHRDDQVHRELYITRCRWLDNFVRKRIDRRRRVEGAK